MRLFVDARYLEERARFDFRACCEDCVHQDEATGTCSLTYPNQDHLNATHQALKDGDVILFCKTFEMG
jgi:hypothetical protein